MFGEAEFLDNYGPFKAGKKYRVNGRGYDYFEIRIKGHLYNVPTCLVRGGEWVVDAGDKRRRFQKSRHQSKKSHKSKRQS